MSLPCPDCGYIHPPLAEGERCPLAKEKTVEGNEVDFTMFFSQLKNILLSNILSKKIKNHKKLFSESIVVLTKYLESYKE